MDSESTSDVSLHLPLNEEEVAAEKQTCTVVDESKELLADSLNSFTKQSPTTTKASDKEQSTVVDIAQVHIQENDSDSDGGHTNVAFSSEEENGGGRRQSHGSGGSGSSGDSRDSGYSPSVSITHESKNEKEITSSVKTRTETLPEKVMNFADSNDVPTSMLDKNGLGKARKTSPDTVNAEVSQETTVTTIDNTQTVNNVPSNNNAEIQTASSSQPNNAGQNEQIDSHTHPTAVQNGDSSSSRETSPQHSHPPRFIVPQISVTNTDDQITQEVL